jgi:hypothetical protein
MKKKMILLFSCFFLLAPINRLQAQDTTRQSILLKLEGQWQGTGKAFGMPAEIIMNWEKILANKFMKITYKMNMTAKDGSIQVFEGTAFYKETQKNEYVATWFDSGGEMHPIKAISDANSLTAIWGTPETKLGKTIYRFLSDTQVEITDFIQTKNGEWRQFNKNIVVKKIINCPSNNQPSPNIIT